MSTPLERAEEAMQDARQELKEAKEAFTLDWKKEDGEELTRMFYKEMKVALKELHDSLQAARKLYNDLVNQQQQQGIGMGC
jgi:hypothetical protein